ncbi:MAG: hypothetical protein WCH32_11710 [Pseudomonadota bacterium]
MAASARRIACSLVFSTLALCSHFARADDREQVARCPQQLPADPGRRSPDAREMPAFEATPCDPGALPPPRAAEPGRFLGLPDRWRIVSTLGYPENLRDPYHGNNWLKGDWPVFGEDWFTSLTAVSDTLLEPRSFPLPVGVAVTERAGSLDLLGHGASQLYAETLGFEAVLYKGDTVFKPPEWEFRLEPVVSINHVEVPERALLGAVAAAPLTRTRSTLGLQAAFVDRHLRNVSSRYDFDSIRIGIQPMTADFRGFLFNDAPLGVRLFGIRANNRYQYNLGWFRRLEKDVNSGLNDVFRHGGAALRHDDVLLANLYAQDTPRPGFTSQAVIVHNRNREGAKRTYDINGVLERPAALGDGRGRDYDVTYVGYNGDGHVGPLNLSVSAYGVAGRETRGTFTNASDQVRAYFWAAELSRDFNWLRVRASAAVQSADRNPLDSKATGFDAILENPLFAGADTSFWIREAVPLVAGGRVSLSGRNGLLASLRSSKEAGQSNFTNPGLVLAGVGADADLTPQLRVSANANDLRFGDTSALELARAQAPIPRRIGLDLSLAASWRPRTTQNIVARFSAAYLVPGAGWRALYGNRAGWAVLANLVLTY